VKQSTYCYTPQLLDLVLQALRSLTIVFNLDEAFISFFENKNIHTDAINKLLDFLQQENDWHDMVILSKIIKEEELPLLYPRVNNPNLYHVLYNHLPENTSIAKKVAEHLQKEYNYEIPEPIEKLEKARKQEEFNILFDKEKFYLACMNIFQTIGSTTINIRKLRVSNRNNPQQINRTLLSFLFDLLPEGQENLTKTEVEEYFKNYSGYLEDYLHNKIFKALQSSKEGEIILTDNQYEHISNWFYKQINVTHLNITINKIEKKQINMYLKAPALLYYLQSFDFIVPDEKLCEAINNPYADFDLISNRIQNKDLLHSEIVKLLRNYPDEIDTIIRDRAVYGMKQKIKEAYPIIVEILQSDFDAVCKENLLKEWFTNQLPVDPILAIRTTFNQPLLIELCQQLIRQNYNEQAKAILPKLLDQPESDKIYISALNLLIWLKDPKALQLSVEYTKKNKKMALHDPFHWMDTGLSLPENYLEYNDISLLPDLLNYLELCLDDTIQPTREWNGSKIEHNLTHLAIQSEEQFIQVVSALKNFITDHTGKYPDVERIHFLIEKVEKQYYEKKGQSYSFKESLQICASL